MKCLMMMSLLLLTACGTTINTCDWGVPIRPGVNDDISGSPVMNRQVVAYNKVGERNCGWKL